MLLTDRSARPVIAHRGGMGGAPENTLGAFSRALRVGADAFELDVRLTRDGHVVVCHDATIDRTTDGTGEISSMSLQDVRQFNAAARWPQSEFGTDRIPLLAEVFDAFPATPMIVELKTVAVAGPAMEVARTHGASARVVFGSFDDAAIAAPRAAGLATLASQHELLNLLPRFVFGGRSPNVPFAAVSLSPTFKGLPVPVSRFARGLSVPVHVWTINDASSAQRLWSSGACGIVSDNPEVIRKAHDSHFSGGN